MRRFSRQFAKLSLYLLIPAFSAIAPLIFIPAVTSSFGASGWAAVAVAISLGNAGAVIAELGWGVIGPQRVAREPEARDAIYRTAFGSKLVAVAALCVPFSIATWFLAPSYREGATLIAVATVFNGLTPAWYYIGLGKPQLLFLVETVPRLILSVIGAFALAHGAPLTSYGMFLLGSSLVVYLLSTWVGGTPWRPCSLSEAVACVRRQGVLVLGRSISTVYTSLPSAFLAIVAPSAVAAFAAADRPMRMGLSVLGGVPARLQAWVGVNDVALRWHRTIRSIWINLSLGLVAGTVYAFAMPPLAEVLFTGTVEVSGALAALGGVLAGLICFSRGLGLAVVAFGRANSLTTAIAIAAPTGVVGVLLLGNLWGALGAFFALIIAESIGALVQIVVLFRCRARIGQAH